MTIEEFHNDILTGVPAVIPMAKQFDPSVNHAPKRKDILTLEEKQLALKNALRYFPKEQHEELAEDFLNELRRAYLHA
jgi:urocanate hydratase